MIHAAAQSHPPSPGERGTAEVPEKVQVLQSVVRFRVNGPLKERFEKVALELGTTPSLLLRKFVIVAVEHPTVAGRMATLRTHAYRAGSKQPWPGS